MSYDGTLKFDTSIDTGGFNTGVTKITSIAKTGVKATATILAGAATAVAAIGTAAVKTGAEFESQMSRVQAISGATGDDFDALKKQAIELGAKTAFSAKEAAEGMEDLASAGFDTNEIMEAMPGMLNLAAASGEGLSESAEIAASTLRGFGLDASEAAHVADVLAENAAKTNAAVADTGEAMKYVSPVAKSMGLSLEEVTAAIGIMSDAGIKGSQAGTTLRSALTRLAKPTSTMQAVMDELGISFYDSEGKMKSLTEITAMLQESMAGLTDEEKQNALVTLFGTDSLSGMMALMDRGSNELAALTESYENCDGAAEEMAETMQNNLSSQVEQFGGGLESLGIAIYEDLKTPLTETMKTLNDFSDSLLTAFNENGFEGLVEQFGTVLAELAQMAMEAAPELVNTAKSLVQSFLKSILENSDGFAEAGAGLVASLASAILEVSGDLWATGIKLFTKLLQGLAGNASDIGASAADLVSDIVNAVIDNLPLMIQAGKDFVQGFFDGMSEKFPGLSALLEGFFSGALNTAGGALEGAVGIISKVFSAINGMNPSVLKAIGSAIGTVAAAILSLKTAGAVLAPIKNLVATFTSIAKKAANVVAAVQKIPAVFSKIGSVVSKAVGFFKSFNSTAGGITLVVTGVTTAVASFVDMFVNGFSTAKEALMIFGVALAAVGATILGAPALVAAAVAGIVAAVATVVVLVKEHWATISAFFSALPGEISEWLSGVIEKVTSWGSQMLENAKTVGSNFLNAVISFVKELPGNVWDWLASTVTKVTTWAGQMLTKAKTAGSDFLNKVISFIKQLPGKVWEWLTGTAQKVATWATNMAAKAKTAGSDFITKVISYVKQLPGKVWTCLVNVVTKVTTWAGNMAAKAKTAGSDFISSVVSAVKQLPGKVGTWLSNTIEKVANWAAKLAAKGKSAASSLVKAVTNGCKSLPSKMVSVGKNIVSGVWKGIKAAASAFKQNVSSFFSGIVSTVKKKLGISSPSKVFAKEVGQWIPPGVGEGVEGAMPGLLKSTKKQMGQLVDELQATVSAESAKISLDKVGQQEYEQAAQERRSQSNVTVQGTLEGDRPIEVHTNLYLDKRKMAEEITPEVNHQLYRIDQRENNRGKGN